MPKQSSEKLWQKAQDAVGRKQWEKAISLLTEFVSLEPNHAEAYRMRGSAYAKRGEHVQSIADYDKALELEPEEDAPVRYGQAPAGEQSAMSTRTSSGLWQKSLQAVRRKEWDTAVALLTEFIAMNPNHAEAYRKRGGAYAKQGEHQLSIADYDRALELEPEDDAPVRYDQGAAGGQTGPLDLPGEGLWQRSLQAVQRRKWDQAISLLSEFISMNPNDAEAYRKRGRAYSKKGEHDLSMADYDKALELEPEDTSLPDEREATAAGQDGAPSQSPREIWHKSQDAFKHKEWDEVTVLLTEYIALNPGDAEAYRKRGYAYSAKGEHARAVADCEKAVELSPESAEAHYDLGLVTQGGQTLAATQAEPPLEMGAELGAELGREDGDALDFLLEDTVAQDGPDSAAERTAAATRTEELSPEAGTEAGQEDEGEHVPEWSPEDTAVHFNLGAAEEHASSPAEVPEGSPQAGGTDAGQPQELEPEDVTSYYHRTLASERIVAPTQTQEDVLQTIQDAIGRKEWDQVVATLTEYIALNPNHSEVYKNRAAAYAEQGEFDLAISDYNKALKLSPRYAEAYKSRGAAYAAKGDYNHAISDYGRALKLSPRYGDAYRNRAAAYVEKGEYERAISDYDKVVRLAPKDAETYKNRGVAYAGQGAYDFALTDFDKAIALAPQDAGVY